MSERIPAIPFSTRDLAIASLVLGVVSFFLGASALVPALLAVLAAHVVIRQLAPETRTIEGLGFPLLGLMLGYTRLIGLVWLAVATLRSVAAEQGLGLLGFFSAQINTIFRPVFVPVFAPINLALEPVYMPWARIVAVGFFVGTMIWVFVGLKRAYVNLDAPSKAPWHDLRFWTIVSMLPHVIVYLWF